MTVAYRRGFKTEANHTAEETRAELGVGPLSPMDPRRLASLLEISIMSLSELAAGEEPVSYLLHREPDVFSAVTVFAGSRRVIVHNDSHAPSRQNSNLTHELAHGLLLHPPTPALDDKGGRLWNQAVEDEAAWLAGVLLVSEGATIEIARGRWTRTQAARHLAVSEQMIQFRLNATGAIKRVERMRRAS